jgi:hypothetical protein
LQEDIMKYTYIGIIIIACLALACISPVTALNNFGSGSAFLQQGQTHTFTVTADSSSQIIMTPQAGANFDLYAVQCQSIMCSCPTASYVMQFATYSSRSGVGRQESFTLPRGTWCVVVFAQSGSGTYTIYENQNPWIVPVPTAPIISQAIPGHGQGMPYWNSQGIQFANPQGVPFGNPGYNWHRQDIPFWHQQGVQFVNPGQGQPNRMILFGNPTKGHGSGALQFGSAGGVILVNYN